MIKKINLLRQEHYVAPALESLVVDAASVICVSPYGETGNAGKFFDDEDEDPNVHSYEL